MALEFLGGAFISSAVGVVCDRLASWSLSSISLSRKRKHDDNGRVLLDKLKDKLLAIRPLLNDAEVKQWTDPAVKDWLDQLKDVLYHADDLQDEIATKAKQSELDDDSLSSQPPGPPPTTTHHHQDVTEVIEYSRIEAIIERLEYFVNIAKDSLGLMRQVDVGRRNNPPPHRLPQTSSLVDHDSVYGRDDDKEKIIQLLISDDDSSGHQISVIPIVGMGGIGKTTLAQLVYNDAKVINHFEEKIWVCVSEEFDILKVTKSILEELNLSPSGDNLNTLQLKLRNRLAEKKFLIVLDDVWNEKEQSWDQLSRPFAVGKHGSKVIVTTRNKNVASIMQTVPIYHLRQLSIEDCWLIFSKHAFVNVSPSVKSSLELIGRKIVEKCKGLPLAAKTLGGLLRCKMEVEEWENVLNSDFWDLPEDKSDILPALLLSYHHLPSHLKLCFAYCAIIPKDYAFENDELVPLWIAEGFVKQPRTSGRVEEIGDSYFRELSSRSLFQQSSGNKFLMHDLINDLAQFVAGEYCFRLADDHPHDISKVRYFSYFKERSDGFAKLKAINEANCLRTFIPLSRYSYPSIHHLSKKILHDVLPTLRCLRVLSLSGYDIVELPDSIGSLIHLRYLDLSSTHIECLPETISTLYNLETLLLRDCRYLTRLPTYLCKLISLRHIDISGTKLTEMPMQIGRLRSLRWLTNFVVGNQIGSAISELREFHHLRGTLSISNLQNALNVSDALEANLKTKKYLEKLNLEWNAEHTDDSQKDRELLDKLQPHINLKHLTIYKYGGTRFPDWLGDHSFLKIKSLCLDSCTNCFELPPLGQLPSLQELTIARMNMVMKVGSEFYGYESSGMKPFQSLKKLIVEDMPEWEEWFILGVGEFCTLLELCISNCPKLNGELPKHLPYLKKLEISGCQCLVIENILKLDDHGQMVTDPAIGAQHLSSLQVLKIKNISELQSLPLELCRLTNLEEMEIRDCPKLNTIQIIGGDHRSLSFQPEEEMKRVNTTLKKLTIYGCPGLELRLYEDTEHHYKFLQDLIISSSCDSLKSLPLGFFPRLHYLSINECRNFESLSVVEGGLPNLTSIEISLCMKLKALPEQMCNLLPSLQLLNLVFLPEIECFPLGGLPSSLSTLAIQNCNKLMASRMEWGLQRLPSLRWCAISGECEEDKLLLESFPEECLLPTSLTDLHIRNRPNMKSLNPNGLRHLNSLQNLWISECPKLQSFPDEGLPSSLEFLRIRGCPLLKVRCQREREEDWLKISHIPCIEVDDEVIWVSE